MVKIKKDAQGLYAQIDGAIFRPTQQVYSGKRGLSDEIRDGKGHTEFKEGQKVRGSHPAGPVAYLRIGKRGTTGYYMEMWDYSDVSPEVKKSLETPESPEAIEAHKKNAAESLEKLKRDVGVV